MDYIPHPYLSVAVNPKKLISRWIVITGRFFDDGTLGPLLKISGKVTPDTDNEYLILDPGNEMPMEEYVWNAGFYGSSGNLDGIGTALSEGRAKLTVIPQRRSKPSRRKNQKHR